MTTCLTEPRVGCGDLTDLTGLVVAAQAGDRAAQGELCSRFRRRIVARATRQLGDEHEAQELCQEVFLQVLQKIGQLREPACFTSWILSIAQRMAVNRVVRRRPAVATEPQVLEATCVDPRTPPMAMEARERVRQLQDGLSRLGSLDRDTLVAFYLRGQTLIEMSTHFDAPIGTIKRRLHVARQRLAKQVEHLVSV